MQDDCKWKPYFSQTHSCTWSIIPFFLFFLLSILVERIEEETSEKCTHTSATFRRETNNDDERWSVRRYRRWPSAYDICDLWVCDPAVTHLPCQQQVSRRKTSIDTSSYVLVLYCYESHDDGSVGEATKSCRDLWNCHKTHDSVRLTEESVASWV
jgi:hypothetical protein